MTQMIYCCGGCACSLTLAAWLAHMLCGPLLSPAAGLCTQPACRRTL